MARPRVVITGAAGVIGHILRAGLRRDYRLTLIDIKDTADQEIIRVDILGGIESLINLFHDHEAVIHLAWDSRENPQSNRVITANQEMATRVLLAASGAGVKRVILASSVHVYDFTRHGQDSLIGPDVVMPSGSYGWTKRIIEGIGESFSRYTPLEVIAIRFGVVSAEDALDESSSRIWLAPQDCVSLLKAILNTKPSERAGRFLRVNAVSDNFGCAYSISNPFGWRPKHAPK